MNKTGRASLRYIDSDSDQVFQITRWGYVRFYPRKLGSGVNLRRDY